MTNSWYIGDCNNTTTELVQIEIIRKNIDDDKWDMVKQLKTI